MRVLMLGPFPLSPGRIDGGVAAAMTYLAQELVQSQGIDLAGVRIGASAERGLGAAKFDWPIVDLPVTQLGLARQYRRERRLLDDCIRWFRPDIVHGQGIDLPGLLTVGCKVTSVVSVHGIIREEVRHLRSRRDRLRARLAEWLIERQTLRMAREVISISPFVTEYYGREIRGRVHEIPNAIAASFFGLPRAPERGRILFAGRINQRKGALDLVHAVGRHPAMTSKLVFAGSSQDAAFEMHLREEIARLRLGSLVQFAGLLDEPSLLDEFSRAEVLVLPSYQETAPMVVQQAMAAGLAVVATDVGGIPHQIEHGATGLLFRAGDVEQLSTHIRRFHDDPALSQQLGSAAKSRAMTRFGAHRVASATRASYELILGDRHD